MTSGSPWDAARRKRCSRKWERPSRTLEASRLCFPKPNPAPASAKPHITIESALLHLRRIVATRNALYRRRLPACTRHCSGPVVSIGNLSAGGSGKTPFVMLLGELLKARGLKFDVLSRGYGRKTPGCASGGSRRTAAAVRRRTAADRPQAAGSCDRRRRSLRGRHLRRDQKFGPQLHLLDDGFQHRALARDFDIVLVTPQDATRSPASRRTTARAAKPPCAARMQ